VYANGVIPRLDLALIDPWLKIGWIVLPLTCFMVAGACNAMNIIDGAHGLAGGTALIMFGGVGLAAAWGGDAATLAEALAVIGALGGFLGRRGLPLMAPEGVHLHSLVYRRIALPIERRRARPDLTAANARVAPRLWLHGALCLALAVAFHDNTPALWACLLAYAAFYLIRYRSLVRFAGRARARRLALQPASADAVKRLDVS
jgi:glycosyl transferase family 4